MGTNVSAFVAWGLEILFLHFLESTSLIFFFSVLLVIDQYRDYDL